MGEYQRELNQRRHDFLLTFFKDCPEYAEREVNGYWLVKQWNGNTQKWQVAIYTQESFKKKKEYAETYLKPLELPIDK